MEINGWKIKLAGLTATMPPGLLTRDCDWSWPQHGRRTEARRYN
jgi:hypothetical protein